MKKQTILERIAPLLLAAALALSGIWLNSRAVVLKSGQPPQTQALAQGCALTGWQQIKPGVWQFLFHTAAEEPLALFLAEPGRPTANGQPMQPLGEEFFLLPPAQDRTVEILLEQPSQPQTWAVGLPHIRQSLELRSILQLMTLTSFITMAAGVMALFHYKRQWELGCFLLYLAVLSGWGLLVMLAPSGGPLALKLFQRLFFPFAVLAPVLLSMALTGVGRPASRHQMRFAIAAGIGLLLAGLSPWGVIRFTALTAGMFYCVALLSKAQEQQVEGAGLLLMPCAITAGLRVWALLPGLQADFFIESWSFYLIRCSRFFDLPFALGCLVFVCRRFALQFDRTEQLARELDLRVTQRTQALTEETEARKSMMLNIFHDLRSPLFAVSSGLDTLARAPEALPTLLPALQQRMNFVRSLTEDLFLAAKLEQKQLLLNEDQVLLNEAAAAVCAACQPEAEKKGITLHAETAIPLPVWGDQVRLQQVVQNLVTNAIHYTPVGGSVQVTCREHAGNALVSVQDTGYGIAPEDQKAVFDRYFHTTAQTKHDSTGLGLTIAQELARLHHGEITLESELGKGSCFTLVLPLLS